MLKKILLDVYSSLIWLNTEFVCSAFENFAKENGFCPLGRYIGLLFID